jgi:O-antigen ligase
MLKTIAIVAFFLVIASSRFLFSPPYLAHGAVFAMLCAYLLARPRTLEQFRFSPSSVWAVAVGWIVGSIAVTFANGPDWRDVTRDLGVVLSFLIGRYAIGAWVGRDGWKTLLEALSLLGLLISIVTLVGALSAASASVSAYVWRSTYIPYSHSWLPYVLVANLALFELDTRRRTQYFVRAAMCVVATLASLSRTDIVLEGLAVIVLGLAHSRSIFLSLSKLTVAIPTLLVALGGLAAYASTDIVQERILATLGEADSSLGWRAVENGTFLDYFAEASLVQQLFGFGWGARLPLPLGVYDFTGQASIPHLHNSYLTIVLKFGSVGLLLLFAYLVRQLVNWISLRRTGIRPLALAGIWMVAFVLGKSVTLQGLTEWSHVMFLGIGALLLSARASPLRPGPESRNSVLAQASGRRT